MAPTLFLRAAALASAIAGALDLVELQVCGGKERKSALARSRNSMPPSPIDVLSLSTLFSPMTRPPWPRPGRRPPTSPSLTIGLYCCPTSSHQPNTCLQALQQVKKLVGWPFHVC